MRDLKLWLWLENVSWTVFDYLTKATTHEMVKLVECCLKMADR